MKASFILALAGLSAAQLDGFDWDVIDAAGSPAVETVPAGVVPATTVKYSPQTAISSVANDVTQSPLSQATAEPTPGAAGRRRRWAGVRRDACQPQPLGSGPTAVPDTAQGFLDFADFTTAANEQAQDQHVPAGYKVSFSNAKGSIERAGKLMGWELLTSYDAGYCASRCNKIAGCRSFNLYFERSPSLDPADSCPSPASTTVIKCVFWGQAVSANLATNVGQWRGSQFQVVIAGSNGYNKFGTPAIPKYNGPVDLGNAAIQAPLDCSGYDTYLGVKTFKDVPFDPSLCAAACTAQSDYNRAHPPSSGYVKTCQFFTTYMLIKNGEPQFQECALYTMAWDASYAKNTGQYRGQDHYTIDQSFSFTNATSPGAPRYPCSG
ncbi:hypothetical protein Micbo1qcDRAFT_236389 [Microdochium bolleyi]|uniref:Apple domain-containing protein n=1 Tax=Microdochium bolleyi TaxID=196109 RepID=A0A136IRT3_9PEZI|nr:hypothetical protein Micbo1qcDRAFT_236389 [Microdochium bolleyi]